MKLCRNQQPRGFMMSVYRSFWEEYYKVLTRLFSHTEQQGAAKLTRRVQATQNDRLGK